MSDDKKLTLDDILAEYDNKDHGSEDLNGAEISSEPEEQTPAEVTDAAGIEEITAPEKADEAEEYDNYEDCEEEDISVSFEQKPMFAPAELFGTAAPEEEKSASDEDTADANDIEENEEIFADDDESGESSDESEEPFDEEIVQEEDSGDEDTAVENLPQEAREWAEIAASESEPELPEENVKAEPEDVPKEEETAVVETSEETEESSDGQEDVNDKWAVRFLKGIFPVKGDSVGEIIRKIIFLIAVIVFIGAGIMLVSTLIQSKEAQDVKEQAKSIITTTVATYIDDEGNVQTVAPTEEDVIQHNFDVAEYYKNINEDYVGYLEVEGCDIYEPVVQGDDNDYYLKTNISGGYNKAGTVFMDYRCKVTEDYSSPNIVLYGHNQEDGTMFGNLKWYKNDPEFYSEHPTVRFSSEFETGTYLIYAYFVTNVYASQDSNGEVFHYHDYIETLNDEYKFNWYINEVQKRNQIVSPVDVRFGDKLLCLSTCSNEFSDSRFVVFARKLRDGESVEDYDLTGAYLNPDAEGVDWEAIMSGEDQEFQEDIDEEIVDEEDMPEETEFEAWAKSNGKKNTGSGAKSDDRRLIPPAPIETETSAPETTVKEKSTKKTEASSEETKETKKKKSTTAASSSEEEPVTESTAESENTAETEPPAPEEGSETEVPSAQ